MANDIKLYLGDCLQEMDNIADHTVDMILTDLPYGVLNKSNANAKWDCPIDSDLLWKQYKRVIKPNGVIALFAQGKFYVELVSSNIEWFKYDLVWDKKLTSGFLNAKKMPLRVHEQIAIFYDKTPTYNPQMEDGVPSHSKGTKIFIDGNTNNNYGSYKPVETEQTQSSKKYPKSILSFQKPHPSKVVHPTQKPVELLEWLIRTYTNEEETVLDSCMGSGSTGVACVNTNRSFMGIEKEQKYFDVAKERILGAVQITSTAEAPQKHLKELW